MTQELLISAVSSTLTILQDRLVSKNLCGFRNYWVLFLYLFFSWYSIFTTEVSFSLYPISPQTMMISTSLKFSTKLWLQKHFWPKKGVSTSHKNYNNDFCSNEASPVVNHKKVNPLSLLVAMYAENKVSSQQQSILREQDISRRHCA